MNWTIADHQSRPGKSFSRRYADLSRDVARSSELGMWQYFRTHTARVSPRSEVQDEAGRNFAGINLGSQDYLGLASHKAVEDAAIRGIRDYGVHSSGSGPMGGGSDAALRLADGISNALGVCHTLLFPTGWAAGYGAIRGIVRPHDYIVMDALAHNCLQHGAYASTPNVSLFSHNSAESLRKRLERIRRKDADAAILVVFESLYSMDSDSPSMSKFVDIAKEFEAHTLVDVAHDFGVLGKRGRGLVGDAVGYDSVDLVVGSFSKVFASIGGFVSSNDLNLIRAAQGFSGSYTFSNYLIPPQIYAAQAALNIAFSEEGNQARAATLERCRHLKCRLSDESVHVRGIDSAMVILDVGEESRARQAYRDILDQGVILNCIEFPAVRRGESRFRIQINPLHSFDDLTQAAGVISAALK